MPQTTENAPRSCSGAGTLRDHAENDGERSAIIGEAAHTAGTEPGSLRKNCTVALCGTGASLAGPRRVPGGATCLIMSHATVSLTWAILRDHGLDHDHGSRRLPRGS